MTLRARQLSKLRRIIVLAEDLIASSPRPKRGRPSNASHDGIHKPKAGKRVRRTGRELLQFRKMLKSERRKGVPVSELARKNGVSAAYIYMLR